MGFGDGAAEREKAQRTHDSKESAKQVVLPCLVAAVWSVGGKGWSEWASCLNELLRA